MPDEKYADDTKDTTGSFIFFIAFKDKETWRVYSVPCVSENQAQILLKQVGGTEKKILKVPVV
jgi:hypothetical protein